MEAEHNKRAIITGVVSGAAAGVLLGGGGLAIAKVVEINKEKKEAAAQGKTLSTGEALAASFKGRQFTTTPEQTTTTVSVDLLAETEPKPQPQPQVMAKETAANNAADDEVVANGDQFLWIIAIVIGVLMLCCLCALLVAAFSAIQGGHKESRNVKKRRSRYADDDSTGSDYSYDSGYSTGSDFDSDYTGSLHTSSSLGTTPGNSPLPSQHRQRAGKNEVEPTRFNWDLQSSVATVPGYHLDSLTAFPQLPQVSPLSDLE